jgi:hypothetical protein
MEFQITSNDSSAEKKLKEELKSLFSEEREELYRIAMPYFWIVAKGSIISTDLSLFSQKEKEQIERLVEKKVIGKRDRVLDTYKVLLFDNFDAKFDQALKHPLGIETYYELKYVAGHSEEDIPILLSEILSKYDKLCKVFPKVPRKKNLATAIALTCRGKYQCPANMSRYFRMAGGFLAVHDAGEKIGESLRYDPDSRIRAYLPKLGLEKDSKRKYMELWKKEKGKVAVTLPYIGGLAYVASYLSGQHLTQKDIGEKLGVTEMSIRKNAERIFIRQGLRDPKRLIEISKEFQTELGFPDTFQISKSYSKKSLQKRLKIAKYLLENNHDKENSIDAYELANRLNLPYWELGSMMGSYSEQHMCFTPYLSPANGGIHYNKKVYVEDGLRVRKYISLMEKLVTEL